MGRIQRRLNGRFSFDTIVALPYPWKCGLQKAAVHARKAIGVTSVDSGAGTNRTRKTSQEIGNGLAQVGKSRRGQSP